MANIEAMAQVFSKTNPHFYDFLSIFKFEYEILFITMMLGGRVVVQLKIHHTKPDQFLTDTCQGGNL